jgi:hypothetical protein
VYACDITTKSLEGLLKKGLKAGDIGRYYADIFFAVPEAHSISNASLLYHLRRL